MDFKLDDFVTKTFLCRLLSVLTGCMHFLHITCAWMKSSALRISWGLVKQTTFMSTNSQMLFIFSHPRFLAHHQQERHPVWKKSAALSVMSDNEKINHLLERASPLRLSLEVVELQWAIKRMVESTEASALSVLFLCM